jgi:hypothetical protein
MANKHMGKTKREVRCQWVRARLPLWVRDPDDRTDANDEGGELSLLEYQKLKRHLDHCPACCQYRSDLKRALQALAAAAAEFPTEPQAPSLWPALSRRIEDFHKTAPSRRSRICGFAEPWARRLSDFATDRRMDQALALHRLQSAFLSGKRRWVPSSPAAASVLRFGLVASLLIAVGVASGIWRDWANAQYTINANALPLADRGDSVPTPNLEPPRDSSLDERETPTELTQAETSRPPEPSGGGASISPEPRPAVPARLGYDLEHGIPMPPDARESKPVY